MITITAFNWVPEFAKGLVRDLRLRWALEEAGLDYRVKLIDHEEKVTPGYREWQPFCQVPAYQDDEVVLFESGAIVLRIAERSELLLPKADPARARAIAWIFAALNSVEPAITAMFLVDVMNAQAPWSKDAHPAMEGFVKKRLADLAQRLSGREWLEDHFTAGDLMMATVLRELRNTDLVTADPVLGPYLARCEARPAFQRALAAQMSSFTAAPRAA